MQSEGQEIHALADPGQRFTAGDEIAVRAQPGAGLYFDAEGRRIGGAPGATEGVQHGT